MSDAVLGMEDLLGRYREAGQVESTGSFTLDPKKALEKLAAFQLPSSDHWILKVVQSLQLARATRVDISAGVHSVTVTADAIPEGFTNMDELIRHLLVDSNHSNPCLRHLAAGLQGSLKTKPRQIHITLVEDGTRRDYDLASGGWRDRGSKPTDSPGTAFQLVLNRSVEERLSSGWFALNTDIFDLFFRRPGSYDRENAVVYDFCQFSTCEVLLDGKSISERRFGQPRYSGYEISQDSNPGKRKAPFLKSLFSQEDLVANAAAPKHHLAELLVPATQSPAGFGVSSESHATLSNRGQIDVAQGLERAYAIRMQLDPKAKVYFVEDGVVIDSLDHAMDCPGLVALIDARNLDKDVSTLKILKNAKLTQVLEDVQEVGATLRQQILDNLKRMPAPNFVASRLGNSAAKTAAPANSDQL